MHLTLSRPHYITLFAAILTLLIVCLSSPDAVANDTAFHNAAVLPAPKIPGSHKLIHGPKPTFVYNVLPSMQRVLPSTQRVLPSTQRVLPDIQRDRKHVRINKLSQQFLQSLSNNTSQNPNDDAIQVHIRLPE